MANRVLTRADDNPGEILEDGELHQVGMWEEVTIERSAAGAPGLFVIITRYENDQMYDQMCVAVPDGAAFLAPVNAWLKENAPKRDMYEFRDEAGHVRISAHGPSSPLRPGYSQNKEDHA